tara:strand:+ start:51 stop:2402 length:2352 start_codon:yes stop_codon:yes gene_type:complete
MIKTFITKLFGRKQTLVVGAQTIAPASVVNIAEYRDPPFRQGLPVIDAADVVQVEPYNGLIKSIRKFADWRNEEFEEVLRPAIEAMADYAGLLPASQSYHHTEGGGALLHALEVGLNALRLGQENYYAPMNMLPSHRAPVNRRYQGVLFLAGLLHDIGKIDTDFLVTDKTGDKVWNPYQCSQVIWARVNQVDRVYLSWNPNRHKNHEARYKGTVARILPKQTIQWITSDEIGDHGRNLWRDLEDALDDSPKNDRLKQIVVEADQKSTTAWMGVNPGSRAEGLSVPVHSYLLDLMREWVKNGKWKCNVKGGRIWYVRDPKTGEERLLISWMAAVVDLTKEIELRNIPGIPRDANRLADVLIQRSFADPFEDEHGELRNYWPFVPERLVKASPTKKNRPLYGLCVRNPDHFLQAMGLPDPDTAEIGQSVSTRLSKLENKIKQKVKNKRADAHRAKLGPCPEAQSAVQSANKTSTAGAEAQSADHTTEQPGTTVVEAQSADPKANNASTKSEVAQSAIQSQEADEANPATIPDAEAAETATLRRDASAQSVLKDKEGSCTEQTSENDHRANQEAFPKETPIEWVSAVQMLTDVMSKDPDVLFQTTDKEDCVNVDLLLRVANSIAEREGQEGLKLLKVRDAFAHKSIAKMGVGMLGTIWVRKENPEGTTVRAISLQTSFAKAVQIKHAELERNNDPGQVQPIEPLDNQLSRTTSITPDQEAQLCEAAMEYEATTTTPGGKLRLRISDGEKLLQTYGMTVADLETAKFATMQIWDSKSGYLLIQKTET